jgi:predicted RNA binding protein YcfA (HicA-like mRNA interferase family)
MAAFVHRTAYSGGVPLKVRDVIRKLEREGWVHVRTSGDHRVFRNFDGRITVVSGNLGDDVRPGTYRAILRQTGIEDRP